MDAQVRDKLVKAFCDNDLSGVCVCRNYKLDIEYFQLTYVFVNGTYTVTIKLKKLNEEDYAKSKFDIYLRERLVLKDIPIDTMEETLNKYIVVDTDSILNPKFRYTLIKRKDV